MSRRFAKFISTFVVVCMVALLGISMPGVVNADPVIGCYATGPSTVNEDAAITVTVQCDSVLTSHNVFGFQFNTSLGGDYDAAVAPVSYTSGTFADISTGATSGVIAPTNTLPGMYAVTRKNNEVVTSENFTLATFQLMAEDNLTVDGTVSITMVDGDFILSNDQGAAIADMLRDVNDLSVTINDIDLAWLTGDMVVRSDVTNISNMPSVELIIGGKTYSATSVASYANTFVMDSTFQYSENLSPDSDDVLEVSATADITGHLACSNATVDLQDAGSATDVDTRLGTSGVITLLSGDADNDDLIDIDDATLIGANIGAGGTNEEDINGDGAINVLDLVHVGRNYNSAIGSCGTGA